MPLNIRSEDVNQLAIQLAERTRSTKTEAVRVALRHELERVAERPALAERLKPLQDKMRSYPRTGLKADKAFYDAVSGDP